METRKLLEELENAVLNASDVPFTNKKMVDKEEVARIIDAINQSLPHFFFSPSPSGWKEGLVG